MAKMRHIAIAVDDPTESARMLCEAFGLKEVGTCDNELAVGVFLTDGTLSIAVLKFLTDQLGKGMDYRGLHHVGFLVEDIDATRAVLDASGAKCVMDRPEGSDDNFFEVKYITPDGFLFDVVDHPWLGSEGLESLT